MEMVIWIFMFVLFSDSRPTFAQMTRDVHLHALEFVDLVVEHLQKLCTQTEPMNAAGIVCGRGRSLMLGDGSSSCVTVRRGRRPWK